MPEPTLQEVSARLNETANNIEGAIKDIKDNKATKQEVLDYIKNETATDREAVAAVKTDVDKLNSGFADAEQTISQLKKDLANFAAAGPSKPSDGRGNYTGKFHSPAEARRFALLVMAAVSSGESRLAKQHEHVVKQLESMGVEPYWVGDDGKAMTGSSQTGGGALVGIEQSPTIIKLLEDHGVFRRNTRIMPMASGQTTMMKIDGLLTVYCPGEGGTITATTPDIGLLAVVPKTLNAIAAYSLELEDDSLVFLGELLADLFTRSFAYYEDLCGFLGDGTSTYFGFKGICGSLLAVDGAIGNIKSLVVGSGNAYSELTLTDFYNVTGTLPEMAAIDAKWYWHRYFYYTVFVALAIASGGTPASEVIRGGGERQKLALGYPCEFCQVMPKAEANSQICALLGDLRMGTIMGVRGGLEFATSDQRYFDQGLIAVRGRDRIAINAHGVGNTTNAGPIVGLITAAS